MRRSSPSSKETRERKTKGPASSKFSLSGDDTIGSGIDYNILDDEAWQTLEHYCKDWGIKQAHLESIYLRFKRTIVRAEHGDFTCKPQSHASLDFLADEFMATAGEFVAQIFIQTWFLRQKRGLRSPEDRRSVNFARLVIMCCDLARLGDFELLSNLWACVLRRFDCLLPSKTLDLDTRLNSELVIEVVTIMHASPSKELDLLVKMLLAHAETDRDRREMTREAHERVGGGINVEEGPRPERQYLSLRRILRFSFQHPSLLFPAVQFQRVLRRKIIGSRFWLRRRKSASDRGVNLRSCIGLPDAYNDLFDRIESRRDAWVVATGHILFHALEASGTNASCGGSDEWHDGLNERYEQLLKNCLRPVWYIHEDTTKNLVWKVMPPSRSSASAAGATTSFTSTASRVKAIGAAAKRAASKALRSRDVEKIPPDDHGNILARASPTGDSSRFPDTSAGDRGVFGRMAAGISGVRRAPGRLDVGNEEDSSRSSVAMFIKSTGKACKAARADGFRQGFNGDMGAKGCDPPMPKYSTQSEADGACPNDSGYATPNQEVRKACSQLVKKGDSPSCRSGATGCRLLAPLKWSVGRSKLAESRVDTSTSDRSPGSAKRAESPAGGNPRWSGLGCGNATTDGVTKPCAGCLKISSRFAMCGVCGGRAARLLKEAQGWRQARVLLERYGEPFGLGLPDALDVEGETARRWVRLYDDETDSDFYYNVHYDRSVWKGAIELRNRGPSRKCRWQRKKGAGGLRVASNTAYEMITPLLRPAMSTPPNGAGAAATPHTATRGKSPALSEPIPQESSERFAVSPRVVIQAEVEDCSVPDVVFDAHRRIYPPFRLVLREESSTAAAAAGEFRRTR